MPATKEANPVPNKNNIAFLLLIVANILAILIKLLIARQGYTYDFHSYLIVSDLVLDSKNVYSGTDRYNYGPVWFLILGTLRWLWHDPQAFQIAIVVFLSLCDFLLSLIFYKKISRIAGVLFALNPVSAIVSGYYAQFDTLAILLGFLALIFETDEKKLNRNSVTSAILLGLSLCIKHLLIFLPFCLLIRKLGRGTNLKAALIPSIIAYCIFLVSFLPFTNEDNYSLIINHVFLYQSVHNVGLLRGFIESIFGQNISSSYLFAFLLLAGTSIFALITSKSSLAEFIALHIAAVFCLLPGMAPQYLAFILPVWLINWRSIYFCFAVLIATALLIAISPGLQVSWLDHRFFRLAMVQLLVAAGIISLLIPAKSKNESSV